MEKKPLTPDEVTQIEAMHHAGASETLYAVLGIRAGAPVDDVEKAYHDIARRFHPDRFYSRDTGRHATMIEENFVAATRAYRTLRDANKRSAYDRELRESGKMPAADHVPVPKQAGHEVTFRPSVPPPKEAPKVKPKAPAAVDKIKQALSGQFARARSYFDTGKADFDAGNFAKAESALYLAVQFDPKNATYKDLHKQATSRAVEQRVKGWVAEAERLEQFGKQREALSLYRKAAEADAPEGNVYFRVAALMRELEDDARGAVQMYRKASQKEPKNVKYRLTLAEQYAAIDLKVNALREAQAVLEIEPKNDAAKALVKKLR